MNKVEDSCQAGDVHCQYGGCWMSWRKMGGMQRSLAKTSRLTCTIAPHCILGSRLTPFLKPISCDGVGGMTGVGGGVWGQ
jgi:hypothetical protein